MLVDERRAQGRGQHLCFVIQAAKPYHYDLNHILAYPSGFRFRNRYDQRWVERDLHGATEQLKGRDILIVMRDRERNRLVPARWATLDTVDVIGNIYNFEYLLGGFVVYGKEVQQRENEIATYTRTLINSRGELEGRPNEDLTTSSVFETAAGYSFREPEDDVSHWGNVVQAVATAGVYEKVDFLKIVGLEEIDGTPATILNEGYQVSHNTVYRMRVFQQVPNFGDGVIRPHDLELRAFPDDVASLRARHRVVGKYELFTFVLRVLDLMPGDRTSIEVEHERTDERGTDVSTSLYIPMIVMPRSKIVYFGRLVAVLATAALIFSPDLLPGPDLQPSAEEVVRNMATVLFVLLVAGFSRTLSALLPDLPWRSS